VSRSEEDAAHAWLCRVHGSDYRRVVGHHFSQAGRPLRDVTGQCFEVVQMVSEVPGDLDPVLVGMGQPELQGAEQSGRARHCRSHESKFPQHALPFLHADSVSAT
jgi:hypothetical protein